MGSIRVALTIYDLGMETVWKACRTVLVSDAGAAFQAEESPATDWARHSIRVLDVIDSQVRILRKRELIAAFKAGTEHLGAIPEWLPPPEVPAGQLFECPKPRERSSRKNGLQGVNSPLFSRSTPHTPIKWPTKTIKIQKIFQESSTLMINASTVIFAVKRHSQFHPAG